MTSTLVRSATHPATRVGWRWFVIVAATGVAFWSTWVRLIDEARSGTQISYVFVIPLLVVLAAQGIARRRADELPIHDRQTDNIVGGLVLIGSIGVKGLLTPRYSDEYQLMHLDLLACWAFVLGSAILLFGLRPVTRFWPAWLLLLTIAPLPYRQIVVALGGSRFAVGFVVIVIAAVTVAIAVSRDTRRAWIGFALTMIVGTLFLAVLLHFQPYPPRVIVQIVPSVGAGVVVSSLLFVYRRRGTSLAPLDRPMSKITVPNATRGIPAVVLAAVVLLLIPLPNQEILPVSEGPPAKAAPGLTIPLEWVQRDMTTDYNWPRHYFGDRATLTRQRWQAIAGRTDWDVQGRRRDVAVDTLTVRTAAVLDVYPDDTMYSVGSARVSPAIEVDLGSGITGMLYTIVDDKRLLTWSKLTFAWTRDATTQRISVISVDDHEPGADFPESTPSMASNGMNSLTVLLRGSRATQDSSPEYKDRNMLLTLGRDIIEAQKLTEATP